MNRFALALSAGLLAIAPALAASPPRIDQAGVVREVTACRKLTDNAERLACYDGTVAKMEAAEAKGDLVTVDREQRTTIRRQAFGLPLPSLAILDKNEKAEEISTQTFKVDHIGSAAGRLVITLEGGQVWRQIDDYSLYPSPHAGSTAVIKRGALNSFFMKLDGQNQIRVHRDQ
jgi:hypothetical protein